MTATYTDNFNFSGGGGVNGGETCGNLIQTGDANLPSGERTLDRWFDTSVFQRPSGRGEIGNNCDKAKVLLPGFHNHDLSIFKDFPIRGTHKMQFRWEIYNLFNHPQWATIDTVGAVQRGGRADRPRLRHGPHGAHRASHAGVAPLPVLRTRDTVAARPR